MCTGMPAIGYWREQLKDQGVYPAGDVKLFDKGDVRSHWPATKAFKWIENKVC
jgi:hypothetical protein